MENEGIMGLPAGQAMQDPRPTDQPTYVSSADSYDAALTALGMSSGDPAQAEAVRQAVRESIDELDLSPTEVSAVLEVLEYMSQRPDEYPALRQRLIESGMMDEDDLPEAYDPTFLGIAIMALNEYQMAGAQGAQAPMQMAPTVEGLEPLAMAKGGLADVAQYLASQGRNGDSILAHITPSEARLLKSMGGSGTINPQTGLPEFFLKKLFKKVKSAVKKVLKNPIVRMVATVALATVLGPAAAAVTGGLGMSTAAATALASTAASAGVSAMAGEKLNAKSLLINAATSYFGAGGTVGGVNPVSSIAKYAGKLPGVTEGGKVAQGIGAGLTSAAVGKAAGMSTQEALGMGLQTGIQAGIAYKPQAQPGTAGTPANQAAGDKPNWAKSDSELLSQGYKPDDIALIRANSPSAQTSVPAAGSPASMTDAQLFGMGYQPDEFAAVRAAAAPSAAPAGSAFSRPLDYLKSLAPGGEAPSFDKFKNAFLVNPTAKEGTLARYVPGVATALTVSGLAGGFQAGKADENPLFNRDYTGRDYMRDNPEQFKGGLAPYNPTQNPYNPIVPTPAYGSEQPSGPAGVLPQSPMPIYMAPASSPTNMPGGVPQPYNVSGMYGVPLLYGNPARPAGYAQGGQVNSRLRQAIADPRQVAQTEGLLYSGPQAAQAAGQAIQALNNRPPQRGMAPQGLKHGGQPEHFPRKTGPINGPGTGTSDSIPAMLSDGEFVFTARAVRNAGGGSRRKGARRMYKLMKMLEGGKVEGK
jgi:hypothetical protein